MGARLPTSHIKAPRDGGHGGKEVDPPAPISRRFGFVPKIQGLDDAITIPNSGMDEGGALAILDEISVLVSDKLQVVSISHPFVSLVSLDPLLGYCLFMTGDLVGCVNVYISFRCYCLGRPVVAVSRCLLGFNFPIGSLSYFICSVRI